MATTIQWARSACASLLLLLTFGASISLLAAEQRYDYDALGRLVRSIEGSNGTDYVYDPAGNLLQVTGGGVVAAPSISGVSPVDIRRGQTATVTVSGTGLAHATVASPSPDLVVSSVKSLANSVEFVLAVAAGAPLGTQAFTISNAGGTVTASLAISPLLPQVTVSPVPLAVPPDSVARSFSIVLTNADSVAHTINLSVSNPAIATVSPASITIPAGQVSAQASITGLSGGSSTLSLTSSTLQTVQTPVYVTAEFAGINTSNAPLVGVVLEAPPAPPATQVIQLGARADVGVVVGGHIRDIGPKAIPRGTSATLTVMGKGLELASAVALYPADGVTLGSLSAAPDGLSATVTVTVADDAPATLRQLVVTDGAGNRFPASRADSDRVLIAYPAPVVESITPVFGTVGAPVSVTLRGRNLQSAKIQLSPGTGIQVDGAPVVNAEGTVASFNLGIGSLTALGEHLVTVYTPGGFSQNVKGPENTFTVVTALNEIIGPITASQLGVVLQSDPVPSSQNYGLYTPNVGVAFGPIVTNLAPRAGIIGETVNVTLQGQELDGVTALTFSPADGITVQSLNPAADGKSVSASIEIAASAPKTIRTVKAWAGATALPFSDVTQSQFQVTAPLPRIDSVTPVNLAAGAGPVALTVRGVNFKDASLVAVSPATDITVSQPPVVSADSTEISVTVTVAAGATSGQRVLRVTTPAGVTDETSTPANTLNIVNSLGDTITPIQAPALGVVKLDDTPPPTINSLLASSDVGVVLQADPPPPATQDIFLGNARLGVTVGPFANQVLATPLAPGMTGTLTVTGMGLDTVTAASVLPATGVTLGVPVIAADGLSLSVPITVAANASGGLRQLMLTAGAANLPFTMSEGDRFMVAAGAPSIDSITPILARQGDTVALTVRGAHLNHATVLIEPAAGVVLGSAPVINAAGTELTLGVHVPTDAALGGRVIRIQTPGGITTDQPEPANTFTVFPP